MSPTRRRILAVDDDVSQARGVALALPEYDVHVTTTGAEALRLLRGGERFDLVVCDVMMPGMSGIQLFVGTRPSGPPFLFVTGCAYKRDVIAFLGEHPHDWLEKPLSYDVLRERVRALLGEGRVSCAEDAR